MAESKDWLTVVLMVASMAVQMVDSWGAQKGELWAELTAVMTAELTVESRAGQLGVRWADQMAEQ